MALVHNEKCSTGGHYDTAFRVFRDRPVKMHYQRPHIVLGLYGGIVAVNWSPPFEGPLCVREEMVEPYYAAYHTYATLLEKSDTKVTTSLFIRNCLTRFISLVFLHDLKALIVHHSSSATCDDPQRPHAPFAAGVFGSSSHR